MEPQRTTVTRQILNIPAFRARNTTGEAHSSSPGITTMGQLGFGSDLMAEQPGNCGHRFCYILQGIYVVLDDQCSHHHHFCSGFGATIRAVGGDVECDEKQPYLANARIRYYTRYCNQLGVEPGTNLNCNSTIPVRSVKILVCSLY
ncbi:unnamed protein product [Thlaspi arvense]|uniref:chitinase n=1 Tax=Thlaspi arvense TaxID=13288 RepID=A0AAU9S4W0_THLAR|nr:unnamed protein product [Thlaspi arvense]